MQFTVLEDFFHIKHIENNHRTFVYSVFTNETKANIFLPRKLDSNMNTKPNSLSTLQETTAPLNFMCDQTP